FALQRLSRSDSGHEAKPGNLGERNRRTQDDRSVEIYPRRRMPRAAQPAPSCRLPLGSDDCALRGPVGSQRTSGLLSRIEFLEVMDPASNAAWLSVFERLIWVGGAHRNQRQKPRS